MRLENGLLYLDLETWSDVPIKAGTYCYAEGAEILLLAYAISDGPVHVWQCQYEKPPEDLFEELYGSMPLVAHNAFFDRTLLMHAGDKGEELKREEGSPLLGGLIDLSPYRWRCVMAQALAHSLPGSLGKLGEVLGLPEDQQKMKDSKALIHLFTKPRPKNMKLRRATRETHPEEWARFVEYARQDVATMREIHKRLPKWNYEGNELALWHLDQRINDRGIYVDRDLVESAIRSSDREQERLAARTQELTDGEVAAATQRDALLKHVLAAHGVALPDMKADTLERRLDDPELPEAVKELLRVRLSSSKTSISKYKRFQTCTSSDGRLRGTLQYCGAGRTGRWSGRLVQLQNLPRPDMGSDDIAAGIEALKADAEDLLFDDPMRLCSNAVRGALVAAPGKKLVVADLSNIEGRMTAWLAGEEWKLQAFRDFDAGIGPDLYKLAYARAFKIDPSEVDKHMRQIGKVMELALQYQGGVGAFVTMAATYGMDLDELTRAALPTLPPDVVDEASEFWDWATRKKRTLGLPHDTFVVCDSLKRLWRRAHPAIVQLWADLDAAFRNAIAYDKKEFAAGRLVVRRDGAWLRVRLPSGRYLCYASPKIEKDKISYMGVCQYSRKWKQLYSYGGKNVEQATQGESRNVFAYNLPGVEEAGFPIVGLVHDEGITEPDDKPEFSSELLCSLLAANKPWNVGLPLAASGAEGYRYGKH